MEEWISAALLFPHPTVAVRISAGLVDGLHGLLCARIVSQSNHLVYCYLKETWCHSLVQQSGIVTTQLIRHSRFFPCVCLFKGHHCQIGLLVNSCFLNTDQHSQFMQPLIRRSSAQIWRQMTQSLYPDLFCMSYISVKGQTQWECVVWSPFV